MIHFNIHNYNIDYKEIKPFFNIKKLIYFKFDI